MTNSKTRRFYWLNLQQDLFGTWCVHKVYGGLTNKHRRDILIPCSSQTEASKTLTDVEYAKRQRGYIYADINEVEFFALKPQTVEEVLSATRISNTAI